MVAAVLFGAAFWAAASLPSSAPNPGAATPQASVAVGDQHDASAEAESGVALHVRRVVLITIDTLRADQPWSGYDKASTPFLSKLAERSTVFLRAYAAANTTGPSIGAMLTSRYPTELQRDDCPLAGMDIDQGLAERLASAGMWTAAVHGHPYFASSVAPRAGFQVWRTVANVLGRRASDGAVTGPDVTEIAIDLLRKAPTNRGVFLWVHYVDPHHKYVRHADFRASTHPARGVYDGEVAFTDHQVGRLLDEIASSSAPDSTAIVLTSDHGEAFGEHGVWRHGTSVFEEEIRVPLMVYVPGRAASRVDAPRSTIDVAPTIAALLGTQQPARWRGRSLLEPDGPEPRAVVVDCPALMNAPARRVAILGRYKVVESAGWTSAFDLESDPDEQEPMHVDAAESLIASARSAFASIHSVPARKCARQAFRPSE